MRLVAVGLALGVALACPTQSFARRFLNRGGNLVSPSNLIEEQEEPRRPTAEEQAEERRLEDVLDQVPAADRGGRAAAQLQLDLFSEQIRQPEEPTITQALIFGPDFESTREDLSVGFTVGYDNQELTHHPFEIALGYAWVNEKGNSTDFSVSGVEGKFALWAGDEEKHEPTFSAVGTFEDEEDGDRRFEVGFAAEYPFPDFVSDGTIKPAANLFYGQLRPDDGTSRDDFIPIVGGSWEPGWAKGAEIAADYTIRNDLDEEDDWSAGVTYKFKLLKRTFEATVGGGKHERVFASLRYTLPLKQRALAQP